MKSIQLLCLLFPLYVMAFLTEPFIQRPTEQSVEIAWFTQHPVQEVKVSVDFQEMPFVGVSKFIQGLQDLQNVPKDVWKHTVYIPRPQHGTFNYHASYRTQEGKMCVSKSYSIKPFPKEEETVRVLMFSDLQNHPMANVFLEYVRCVGAIGCIVDAGDLVSEGHCFDYWFSPLYGLFPVLQGKGRFQLDGRRYAGASFLQNTPYFPAYGNHDASDTTPHKTDIFTQFFGLERPYYARKIGGLYLIVLAVAPINGTDKNYVSIAPNSPQFTWLCKQVQSKDFLDADVRMVAFHYPLASLNDWDRPLYLHHEEKGPTVRQFLIPFFEKHGIDLVLSGHHHTWFHFTTSSGMHLLNSALQLMKSTTLYRKPKLSCGSYKGVFPSDLDFYYNGEKIAMPNRAGATFSILDSKARVVTSYFVERVAAGFELKKLDVFYLRDPQ